MKELSIKEKAKRYDEALKVLHKYDGANIMFSQSLKEEMFPELKESEDEVIRKEMLDFFNGFYNNKMPKAVDVSPWIAWLEKQGEKGYTQKDIDDAYLKGIADVKREVEKQDEQTEKMKKDIAEFIFNSKEDIKYRYDWIKCLGYDIHFIDEEKQGEQNPKFRIGDTIKKESTGDIVTISEIDLKNREYRLSNTGFIPFKYEYLWKLVEQKPADKTEPKFHEGDLVTNGKYLWRIIEVKPLDYILQSQNGEIVDDTISYVDKEFRSWTLQDAKDGDVLTNKYGDVMLFKGITDDRHICGYCQYSTEDRKLYNECSDFSIYYPATKEQCALLFQKMKEAGYEWDAVKKELKKIEQMSAWSEDDDKTIDETIELIEEVEKQYQMPNGFTDLIIKLKSLRPQNRWKPSDEQIKALETTLYSNMSRNDERYSVLSEFVAELKKLKG